MKTFTISAALTLLAATLVHAAPTPAAVEVEARQFAAQITFQGATPEAQFTMSFPADGTVVAISKSCPSPSSGFYYSLSFTPLNIALTIIAANPLSISHIKSAGGATCSFKGIDGSNTIVVGAQTVDVGPPQTQVSGSCRAF